MYYGTSGYSGFGYLGQDAAAEDVDIDEDLDEEEVDDEPLIGRTGTVKAGFGFAVGAALGLTALALTWGLVTAAAEKAR